MTFHDHFSARAAAYARFRPHYPDALFAWLASIAPGRRLALDCATGNGQAATALARHFDAVLATDASAAQLAHAEPARGVTYRQAPAHESGLAAGSADLVTVAQALHWLDRPAFYAEARRVLASRGVVAVWCYGVMTIAPALDEVVAHFYHDVVGPWWPPERHLAEAGYRDVEFPFAEIAAPPLAMTASMTLDALMGYVGTWSATARYTEARGHSPLPALRDSLAGDWGDPAAARLIRWPLGLRAGLV